jgi:hypothetical protein
MEKVLGAAMITEHQPPSLRAKRSNPCQLQQSWIASSLTLLAMTIRQKEGPREAGLERIVDLNEIDHAVLV